MNILKKFQTFLLCLLTLGVIFKATAQEPDSSQTVATPTHTAPSAAQLDWHAHTQAQLDKDGLCFCDGHYIQPENNQNNPEANLEASKAPLYLSADQSNYLAGSETLKFLGNIEGVQGNFKLYSDTLDYNKNTQEILLKGNVQLREHGSLLLGQEAKLHRVNRFANFKEASYLIYDSGANGSAQQITRTPDEKISMRDASYTLCQPNSNAWKFKAEDITLDIKNSEGVAKNTRLYVKDIPVLYLPYFNFPLNNKRKTGFLFPSYANGSSGLDISTPYYINLAPNYDMTLIPRYVSHHGTLLETETRYLNKSSSIVAGVSYLPTDKNHDKNSKNPKDRWLTSLVESGHLGKERRFTHNINFERVSDKEYLEDLGATGLDIRRAAQLQSSANLGYQAKNWNTAFFVESYQNLREGLDKAYRRMPQISFNYYDDFLQGIYASFDSELTYFDHPERTLNAVGNRLYYAPAIGIKKVSPGGKIELKAGLKHLKYNLTDNPNKFEQNSSTLPNFKLDASTYFERTTANNYTQLLEPRIQYYYARSAAQTNLPTFDSNERTESYYQLFNEERFTGHDRITDGNRISLGLNTHLLNTANQQVLEAGIAQQFYFNDRKAAIRRNFSKLTGADLNAALAEEQNKLTRKTSHIATYLNFDSNNDWRLSSEYLFNPDTRDLDSTSINYHRVIGPDNYQIFNLGYQYKKDSNKYTDNPFLEDDLHQVGGSTIFKVNKSLNAIALINYDLSNRQPKETLLGLEYNNCCWQMRLAFQKEENVNNAITSKDIEYDTAVLFEVKLKGISGIADNISNLLGESIEGFDVREKNFN